MSIVTVVGAFGQVKKPIDRRTAQRNMQVAKDTARVSLPDSLISKDNQLTTRVKRYAKDSVIFDAKKKTYQLYKEAKVEYLPTKLGADYILLDWANNEVYAHGVPDTSKKVGDPIVGKPVFEDGTETYHMDTIRYNFKSKKAKIYDIATVQGEGYIHGKTVKKDQFDNLHLADAKYTTCDLEHPHFYISAKKIMFVNKKSAVSGPFNLVVHDIPLPVGFLFGFFPVQKQQEIGTSGFVMGSYGEQRNDGRGFYFNDFGYYHAFNDKISNTLTGQIYSRGSFGVKEQIDYAKKYKYSGKFSFQYNKNFQTGTLDTAARSSNSQMELVWSHTPRSLRTDRSFSSNINYRTTGFSASNVASSNYSAVTQNTVGGSVNYMRNFGKLFSSNYAYAINQNQSSNTLTSGLTYSFQMKQVNPFVKEKDQTGRWWESFRVGMNVNGGYNVTNTITTRNTSYTDYNIAGITNSPYTDEQQRRINELNVLIYDLTISSELRQQYQDELDAMQNPRYKNFKDVLKNGILKNSYSIPISLPNMKILKFINLTPSISLSGDMYDKSLDYQFVNETKEITLSNGNKVSVNVSDDNDTLSYTRTSEGLIVDMNSESGGVVVVDTVSGLSFANKVSFGASMNTRFYGKFNFGKRSRIQTIRHTVNPSVGFSYTPANKFSTYQQVRSDGTMRYLPKYVGGTGSSSRDAGNLSFAISNQLEAKMRSDSDTSETDFEKVMLLDNFNLSTSYNIFAKKELNEFAWSNLSLSTNTSVFKRKVMINGSASFDPYIYRADTLVSSNLAGIRIPYFKWDKDKQKEFSLDDVGQYLQNLSLGLTTTLNPEMFGGEDSPKKSGGPGVLTDAETGVLANPMDYVDFSIPWNLSLRYSFSYNKQGLAAARISNAFSFSGDVSLTPNTKITFNSGWDFRFKQFTLTTIGFVRELHCWMFSLDWTPLSGNNMRTGGFNFTLRPKANLLKDLKVNRRRSGSY